jgi:prolyl 4-hydroxylase
LHLKMAGNDLYIQAAVASREGRRDEARHLLLRAADAGHADSYYTLATMDLLGLGVAKDPLAACEKLERAVSLGSNIGRRALATLTAIGCGRSADWSAASALVVDAAQDGDREAQREVAVLAEIADPGNANADALLRMAALAGDVLAAVALLRRWSRGAAPLSREERRALVGLLESVRHPLTHQLCADADEANAVAPGEVRWDAVRELLSRPPSIRVPVAVGLSGGKPDVVSVASFATVEECDYVIGKAAPMLRPSAVIDERTGQAIRHPVRTSFNATLWPLDQDLVIHVINERMAALAGLPGERGEMLSVLCYRPGQEYRPHFDFLSEGAADRRELERAGQRVTTVLLYLNDDYEGGETHFLENGLKVKGATGSAVMFRNTDDAGVPDRTTRHAGVAVDQGTKWLGSKWFRARQFDPLG